MGAGGGGAKGLEEGVFSLRQHEAAAATDGVPWRQEDTTWRQQGTAASAAARKERVAAPYMRRRHTFRQRLRSHVDLPFTKHFTEKHEADKNVDVDFSKSGSCLSRNKTFLKPVVGLCWFIFFLTVRQQNQLPTRMEDFTEVKCKMFLLVLLTDDCQMCA